eukprot:jgi/Chlat1/4671/Chrsp3S05637
MSADGGSSVTAAQTAATLLQALQALYHHPDEGVKKAADRWLEEFQHSVEAWQVTDGLLHDDSIAMEVQYFCAQTLCTKVQKDFEELPPGAGLSLRDSMLVLLARFANGPPALCLATAALAAHTTQDEWQRASEGAGVVQWLRLTLGSDPSTLPCMLELLHVLPQEAGSHKIAVVPDRRRQFWDELQASASDALSMLAVCYQQYSMKAPALAAYSTWLRLCEKIPAREMVNHPLMKAALDGLDSLDTFDDAVDAVCELIRYSGNCLSQSDDGAMAFIQILVQRVLSLRPRLAAAAARVRHAEPGSSELEDEDTAKALARVFAEVGETYVTFVAEGTQDGVIVVESLLDVAAYPDDEIAATTFNFWHDLQRALVRRPIFSPALHAAGDTAMQAEKDRRISFFQPAFSKLVTLISGRVRYPLDFESWRDADKKDFKRSRYAVADTLIDAADVLGGETVLRLLLPPLQQSAEALLQGRESEWRAAEAALYSIRAVSKSVPHTESAVLPQVMSLLPRLPAQPQLLYTAALTIAAYADWLQTVLAADPSAPLIPTILQYLTSALSAGDDAAAAVALALKHVCDACAKYLTTSLDALLQVYRHLTSMDSSEIGQASPPPMDNEDFLQILEGISLVVAALPDEQLPVALSALLQPIATALQRLLATPPESHASQTAHAAAVQVDRLATIVRHVARPKQIADAFQKLWPLVQACFDRFASDPHMMERLCRACKYALRSAGKEIGPLLPVLVNEIQVRFNHRRQSSFLYLANELVKLFGSEQSCSEPLAALLSTLFDLSCATVRTLEDMTAQPDIVDDLFLLASRCLKSCPQLFIPAKLPQLIQCALVGTGIQHREACSSVMFFIQGVLQLPTTRHGTQFMGVVESLLQTHGRELLARLFKGLAGGLPENRLDDVAEVLGALAAASRQQLMPWAMELMSAVPAAAVPDINKQKFVQALAAAANGQTNPANLMAAVDEMSDLCRRTRRVQDMVHNAVR